MPIVNLSTIRKINLWDNLKFQSWVLWSNTRSAPLRSFLGFTERKITLNLILTQDDYEALIVQEEPQSEAHDDAPEQLEEKHMAQVRKVRNTTLTGLCSCVCEATTRSTHRLVLYWCSSLVSFILNSSSFAPVCASFKSPTEITFSHQVLKVLLIVLY